MNRIQFVGTSDSEFLQRFKDEIIPELKNQLAQEFQPKVPTEYLTRREACDLLKVNLSTIWRWQRDGTIPSYGIANRVYFKRHEIEQIINQNKLS